MSGETESNVSGWTTDTLHEFTRQQLDDLRTMLDERYATQTKAIDAAFSAQQLAMQTALTAADRAVQAALQAAERAVTKAEVAAEKRFESMNEFRGQLADQAATFVTRHESELKFDNLALVVNTLERGLSDKRDALSQRIESQASRVDLMQGAKLGFHSGWLYLIGGAGLLGTLTSMAVAIYIATKR